MNPLEQTRTREQSQPKKIISILTAKELGEKEFTRPKWVIDNLFQSGTMNMLSAAPNNYKSWLTLDIAMSVATGAPLFTSFFVSEISKVWIINEEDIEPEIKDRMETLNKRWVEASIYFSVQNQLKLDNETVDQIISLATEKGIRFIILDSLRSIHDAEENSATEMQKIMDQLKKITNMGISVLFTHHNRKKSMFRNNSDSEDSRGSTAINAAVHGHLSLEPKKEDGQEYLIVRQAKLKGAKKMEPFLLRINLDGGGSGFIYEGEYNVNASHAKVVEKIIKLLEDQGGKGINIKGFVSADIIGERTLRKVLKEMEDVKSITSKVWGKVREEGLPVLSDGTSHNEKFFFLPSLPPEF